MIIIISIISIIIIRLLIVIVVIIIIIIIRLMTIMKEGPDLITAAGGDRGGRKEGSRLGTAKEPVLPSFQLAVFSTCSMSLFRTLRQM